MADMGFTKDVQTYTTGGMVIARTTNADRIRAMTDEELAKFIGRCENAGYADGSIAPDGPDGWPMEIIDWLRQPAEETP